MRRLWVHLQDKVMFILPKGQYLCSYDSEPDEWDLDCIGEQLQAVEAGLA